MAIIPPLPNNIVNGTTIDAVPVMGNFNAIVADVNANAAPLASPTFTGTVTGPDAGTWSSSGFSNTVIATGTLNFLTTLEKAGVAQATGPVGQLPGTATNDSASAGNVGEFVSSNITSPQSVSLNTLTNLTTIALTAGDWDVWGCVQFQPAAGTTVTNVTAGVSNASATLTVGPTTGNAVQVNATMTTALNQTLSIAPIRLSLSTSGTAYLVILSTFGVSTMAAIGFIAARRVR